MGQVQRLSQRHAVEFNPSYRVEFFDVSTREGHSYLGVKLDSMLPNGTQQEFRTDLSKLEEAAQQVREYSESRERHGRTGAVGDIAFRMWREFGNRPGELGEVVIDFAQKARDGSGEWQLARVRGNDFASTIRQGKELERELGLDKRWFVVVDAHSIEKKEGRIYGHAFQSFENEEQALSRLGKSSGLALYSVPQNREYRRGEAVELWDHATVLESRTHKSRSVKDELERAQFSRERMNEYYVVARWNDAGREPQIGMRAEWEGASHAYNGEPQDFKAGPTSGRDRGRPQQEMFVLIERDEARWGRGRIVGMSPDRGEMTAELGTLTEERTQKVQNDQEVQRAVGRDWEQQAFTMDRRDYTQGYSM
jgi:hypothetical protein